MSNELEIRTVKKDELYDLLTLKEDLKAGGNPNLKALDKLINKKEAVMDAEDVAYVEKKIAELE